MCVKAAKADDPVLVATAELFSDDLIGSGEAVRAADVLIVAEQLGAAIGPKPSGNGSVPIGGFA
jgi:hypothetical protein